MHNNLENSTCDPLKYIMDSHILIVSICMRKSTRIQMIKSSSLFQSESQFSNTDLSDFKIIFPVFNYYSFDFGAESRLGFSTDGVYTVFFRLVLAEPCAPRILSCTT